VRGWRPAIALAVIAGGAWMVREARQQAAERPASPQTAAPATASELPAAQAPAPRLLRDPFRYAEPVREPPRPAAFDRHEPEPQPTPTPEAAVRLSGFVRSGGRLRAVLVLGGTVGVAAAGDALDGYRVLSVDEDAGVRLKTPAGEELLLSPKLR
jgi:hypothetical protein